MHHEQNERRQNLENFPCFPAIVPKLFAEELWCIHVCPFSRNRIEQGWSKLFCDSPRQSRKQILIDECRMCDVFVRIDDANGVSMDVYFELLFFASNGKL